MEDLSIFFSVLIIAISCTAFAKVLTVLSVLRLGLGMRGAGFGLVVVALSALISWYTMHTLLGDTLEFRSGSQMLERLEPFLDKHGDPGIGKRLDRLTESLQPSTAASSKGGADATPDENVQDRSLAVKGLTFLLTELSEAFKLSFLILVPFIVVDILVLNLMLALGTVNYSHEMIALPLKLLLFFAIDGWVLITEKILLGYSG